MQSSRPDQLTISAMRSPPLTRRELLCRSGMGLASLGLAGLLAEQVPLVSSAVAADGYTNPMLPSAALLRSILQ